MPRHALVPPAQPNRSRISGPPLLLYTYPHSYLLAKIGILPFVFLCCLALPCILATHPPAPTITTPTTATSTVNRSLPHRSPLVDLTCPHMNTYSARHHSSRVQAWKQHVRRRRCTQRRSRGTSLRLMHSFIPVVLDSVARSTSWPLCHRFRKRRISAKCAPCMHFATLR